MSDIERAKASSEARAAVGRRHGSGRTTEQLAEAAIRRYIAATEYPATHRADEQDDRADHPSEDGEPRS